MRKTRPTRANEIAARSVFQTVAALLAERANGVRSSQREAAHRAHPARGSPEVRNGGFVAAMVMFFRTAGTSFRGSRFFVGIGELPNREKWPVNTQHQNAIESPVGFAGGDFRVVAGESNDFAPRLLANRIAIVFPSLHSLVCYAKHLSHLDIGQIPVGTRQPEMFAERLRMH